MRDKVVFGVSAVLISIALYVPLWWARSTGARITAYDTGFVVPVLALMLAARGFGWPRKAAFLAGTVVGFLLIETLASVTGVGGVAAAAPGSSAESVAFALGTLYVALVVAFPLSMLALFVGRRPTRLWSAEQEHARGRLSRRRT